MSKYIDTEKLLAEIARLRKEHTTREYRDEAALVLDDLEDYIDSLQQETSEISLETFIEKMDAWKARFSRPDDIPIKATMAFTARMFYMYPDIAREWYVGLPKAIPD